MIVHGLPTIHSKARQDKKMGQDKKALPKGKPTDF